MMPVVSRGRRNNEATRQGIPHFDGKIAICSHPRWVSYKTITKKKTKTETHNTPATAVQASFRGFPSELLTEEGVSRRLPLLSALSKPRHPASTGGSNVT